MQSHLDHNSAIEFQTTMSILVEQPSATVPSGYG